MASKNDSASSPVRPRMASARAGEVRGPVATITLSQSAGGSRRPPRARCVTREWASSLRRSPPGEALAVDRQRAAGRHLAGVGGGHDQRAAAAHLGVQQADGVVLPVVRAEGVGTDQLGQVRRPWWASVPRTGRISCSTTGTPAWATCQAASEPARPPPMMWMGFVMGRRSTLTPLRAEVALRAESGLSWNGRQGWGWRWRKSRSARPWARASS